MAYGQNVPSCDPLMEWLCGGVESDWNYVGILDFISSSGAELLVHMIPKEYTVYVWAHLF